MTRLIYYLTLIYHLWRTPIGYPLENLGRLSLLDAISIVLTTSKKGEPCKH